MMFGQLEKIIGSLTQTTNSLSVQDLINLATGSERLALITDSVAAVNTVSIWNNPNSLWGEFTWG